MARQFTAAGSSSQMMVSPSDPRLAALTALNASFIVCAWVKAPPAAFGEFDQAVMLDSYQTGPGLGHRLIANRNVDPSVSWLASVNGDDPAPEGSLILGEIDGQWQWVAYGVIDGDLRGALNGLISENPVWVGSYEPLTQPEFKLGGEGTVAGGCVAELGIWAGPALVLDDLESIAAEHCISKQSVMLSARADLIEAWSLSGTGATEVGKNGTVLEVTNCATVAGPPGIVTSTGKSFFYRHHVVSRGH